MVDQKRKRGACETWDESIRLGLCIKREQYSMIVNSIIPSDIKAPKKNSNACTFFLLYKTAIIIVGINLQDRKTTLVG